MSTITKKVNAQDFWTSTDVRLTGKQVTITATGRWSANPSNGRGMFDANGDTSTSAKDSYALPGKPESLLVGYVGDSPPSGGAPAGAFAIGTNLSFSGKSGTLFLTINDDIPPKYGAGYPDNAGSLDVTITVE